MYVIPGTERALRSEIVVSRCGPTRLTACVAVLVELLVIWFAPGAAEAGANLEPCLPGATETVILSADSQSSSASHSVSAVFPSGIALGQSTYQAIIVNVDGSVSFGQAVEIGGLGNFEGVAVPIIAPFFADASVASKPGFTNPGRVLLCDDPIRQRIMITWLQVPRAGAGASFAARDTNSFQLILHHRGALCTSGGSVHTGIDAEFRYAQLAWDELGERGGHARCGIRLANGESYEFSRSGSPAVKELTTISNVGASGVLIHRMVDGNLPRCGNKFIDVCEDCEGGTANCSAVCEYLYCGDGIVQPDEQCDDGNNRSNDGCTHACTLEFCGDSYVQPGLEEECDSGDECNPDCTWARCGDGYWRPGMEECDDGNADNSDDCLSDCRLAACGDGFVNATVEECDQGDENSDTRPDRCRTFCAFPRCGDGVVDSGEECDDGLNNSDLLPGACRTHCAYDPIYAHGSGGGCEVSRAGDSGSVSGLYLLAVFFATLSVLVAFRCSRRPNAISPLARGFWFILGMAVLSVAVGQGPASAQSPQSIEGFRVNRYIAPATTHDGLVVQLPTTLEHLRWSANLTFDLADVPLIVSSMNDPRDSSAVLSSQFMSHVNVALGLGQRWQFVASLPMVLSQNSTNAVVAGRMFREPNGTAVGDPVLGAVLRLSPHSARNLQLGLAAALLVPAGASEDYVGDDGFGVRGMFIASYVKDRVTVAGNAGLAYRPSRDYTVAELGPEIFARSGVHLLATDRMRVMLEADIAASLTSLLGSYTTHAEALVGVRYHIHGSLHGGVGLGAGLTEAVGTPALRVLLSVGWADTPQNGQFDRDRDGLLDGNDRCVLQPEDIDGFQDRDGCPDADNDGDGLIDDIDGCPTRAEDPDGFEDSDGCPDVDNDGDRILDAQDHCPNQAEVINNHRDDDGCPDDFQIIRGVAQIPARIEFEFDSAAIKAISIPELERLARILQVHRDVGLLSIEGHTSDEGSARYNKRLSERRAMAVVKWLVANGIDVTRLEARGWGESRPIMRNDSELNRSINRRVEFHILRRGQTRSVPGHSIDRATEGKSTADDPARGATVVPTRSTKRRREMKSRAGRAVELRDRVQKIRHNRAQKRLVRPKPTGH